MFIHEDEDYLAFCEYYGLNPEDEASPGEYAIALDEHYNNPHA